MVHSNGSSVYPWRQPSSKVGPLEGLSEAPVGRSHIVGDGHGSVAGDGLEGDGLAVHSAVARELPHLPPVALQGDPVGGGALDEELLDVARASHIGDED